MSTEVVGAAAKANMGNETRMDSRNDFIAISDRLSTSEKRRHDRKRSNPLLPCEPHDSRRWLDSCGIAATFFFERHAAALHSRARLVGKLCCAKIVSDRRHARATIVGAAR